MERIIAMDAHPDEAGDRNFCISLAALCGQKETDAPHGLVLKSGRSPAVVLLTPKIQTDMELPDAELRAFPRSLAAFLRYFRGAFLDASGMILALDPETIIKDIP
jgi:chemotaxis signal transduction protein